MSEDNNTLNCAELIKLFTQVGGKLKCNKTNNTCVLDYQRSPFLVCKDYQEHIEEINKLFNKYVEDHRVPRWFPPASFIMKHMINVNNFNKVTIKDIRD